MRTKVLSVGGSLPGRGALPTAPSRVAPALVALASALSVACAPGEEGAPDAAAPPGTPVDIAPEPRLSVGVVEGDPVRQLHRVVTPFLLPDGRLVVPVAGAREIRVFGPDGGFVTRLGGEGEGPGEFTSLDAAWARGDTIEAYDRELRRVTRFFPDGSSRGVELEPVAPAQMAFPGPLPDGWAVAGLEDAGMGRRDEVAVHRFGRDGAHRGVIARVEGMARVRLQRGGGGPDPLSPRPVFAVRGGEVYVGETFTPRIRVLGPAGNPVREIAWEPGELPDPEEAFGAAVDAVVAEAGPERAAENREFLEAFPVRERVSAFWSFLVDDEGFVWVRPYDPNVHSLLATGIRGAAPGGEWLVFSPAGERVGSVEVPEGLEPVRVTSDAVVGIRRGHLDVESVHVHPLQRE